MDGLLDAGVGSHGQHHGLAGNGAVVERKRGLQTVDGRAIVGQADAVGQVMVDQLAVVDGYHIVRQGGQ